MIKTSVFVTAMGLLVYGQVAPPEMPLAGWSNLPAVGLLMFLLYWIVVKQQPKERQEAREHTERLVNQLGRDSREIQQQQNDNMSAVTNKISLLAENCSAHLERDK